MASKCIDDCLNVNGVVRVRATTYATLHKWPQAEAEFVRSISRGGGGHCRAVADELACRRQMYLRSYTFSRNEECSVAGDDDDDVADRRCLGGLLKKTKRKKKTAKKGVAKGKTMSSRKAFMYGLVRKWTSCVTSTKVDVDQ